MIKKFKTKKNKKSKKSKKPLYDGNWNWTVFEMKFNLHLFEK